jgi:hypothetical protein
VSKAAAISGTACSCAKTMWPNPFLVVRVH